MIKKLIKNLVYDVDALNSDLNNFMEVGTTNGWNWIKFSNGIAICTYRRYPAAFPANTEVITKTLDFPFALTTVWSFNATLYQNTSAAQNAGVIDIASYTTTNFTFHVFHNISATIGNATEPQFSFTIIGKWK